MISATNQNSVQKFAGEVVRYAYDNAPSRDQVASNVRTVAMPAIAMAVATQVEGAQADPFTDCIRHCDAQPTTLAKALCYGLCWLITK